MQLHRAGWIRLWVALCGLLLCIIGLSVWLWVSAGITPVYTQEEQETIAAAHQRQENLLRLREIGEIEAELRRRGKAAETGDTDLPLLDVQIRVAIQELQDAQRTAYARARWDAARQAVQVGLAAWAALCMALYAIGAGVGWIVRGFRTKTPSSEE